MAIRKLAVFPVIFSMILPIDLGHAAVVPKLGKICKTNKQEIIYKYRTFKCTKKLNKLVWALKSKKPLASVTKSAINNKQELAQEQEKEQIFLEPKLGKLCPSLGEEKNTEEKIYECFSYGEVNRWKIKSINYGYLHNTDLGYTPSYAGPCDFDADIPEEWIIFQSEYTKSGNCAFPIRIKKFSLGTNQPKTLISGNESLENISKCKIRMGQWGENTWTKAFFGTDWPAFHQQNYLKPNVVIQLIPIFASDTAKPVKAPSDEYGKYLRYLKDWVDYSSDVTSNVRIQIPEKYFEYSKPIKPLKIWHHGERNQEFANELVNLTDPFIDFTGVNIGIVVVPGGTPLDVIQQGPIGNFNTKEGVVHNVSAQYPDTLENPFGFGLQFANLRHPGWWLHELYHLGLYLDDHYGDNKNDSQTEHGLGWWSLMTPSLGDMTIWEKWIVGFVSDQQIICTSSSGGRYWIAPSSVSTKKSKAVIIPLDSKRVVVLESIRAAGLYYKNPIHAQGLLAYVVDLNNTGHGFGLSLIYPKNRKVDIPPFFMSAAPLQVGESVEFEKVKISVIEAGNFGDVVEIQRVS